MPENIDEISLKDIILKVKEWWQYLLSKWLIIIIAGLIGGTFGLLYAVNKQPTYTGTLSFVLSNDSRSGTGGGLASLAGQFGLDIGGGGNGAFEGENIIELLKSKRIVKGALLKSVPGEKDILINLVGNELGFFERWKKNGRINLIIPFPGEINKITPAQDSLITIIYSSIIKENLNVAKQDKKLSFYQVSTMSINELVSVYLTKNIVDEAARMYIDTKTKTARENLNMLQHEADSLRGRLDGTIYASANQIDQTFNLNPALQTKRAPIQQNQIQAQVLGTAYGEVIKNLEIAKITLQKETPLYQIIDEPQKPLTMIKASKIKGIITGGVIAAIIVLFFLVIQRVYKKVIV